MNLGRLVMTVVFFCAGFAFQQYQFAKIERETGGPMPGSPESRAQFDEVTRILTAKQRGAKHPDRAKPYTPKPARPSDVMSNPYID